MTLSTLAELQAQYAALSARIAALDRDIGLALDREQRTVAQAKRDELAQERERVTADILLQGGTPQYEAQIEHRVSVLEREVNLIKRILRPGPRHRLARFLFYIFMVALASIWVAPDSREWLWDHPIQALAITGALLGAMAIVLYLPEDIPYD